MARDEYAGLPDAIAGRARRFREADPTISKAESVVRAMNDPSAALAYAADVRKHDRAVAAGNAKGPTEPKQFADAMPARLGQAGEVLERVTQQILTQYPELTRAQAVAKALKDPRVADAYEVDIKQERGPAGNN